MSRTAFVGLSHLGIAYSAAWASRGAQVVGVDPQPGLATRLSRLDPPVHEPGLVELMASCGARLAFTDDLSAIGECELVVVSRDVPTSHTGVSDLGPVVNLIESLVPHLPRGVVVVLMSQVSPGFTRAVSTRIRHARPELAFELYYWVETLVFGDAVRRATRPERIIVGCEDPAAPMAPALQIAVARFECPVLPMIYESAELTKTAINLYLVASVTCTNALADLCERVGADWPDIVPALRLDARIGPAAYLKPSLGVAGGNLERDLATLRHLAEISGADATLFETLAELNRQRVTWVNRVLENLVFPAASTPSIAVWGLTYKKNTHSTKNSPALRLISLLDGRARVRAWDPAVRPESLSLKADVVIDRDDALNGADCLLIMSDWDEFRSADLDAIRQRTRRPLIIDCAGVLAERRNELAGIEYVTMGVGQGRQAADDLAGVAV